MKMTYDNLLNSISEYGCNRTHSVIVEDIKTKTQLLSIDSAYVTININHYTELPDNVRFSGYVEFIPCDIHCIPCGVIFEQTCSLSDSSILHIDSSVVFKGDVYMTDMKFDELPFIYASTHLVLDGTIPVGTALYVGSNIYCNNDITKYSYLSRIKVNGYLIKDGILS